MRTLAVIPARFGSTRLPAKPLLLIAGKPLVQHVYEIAARVPAFDELCVATDDIRIRDAVAAFGGEAVMTSADCASGTDRLREVMRRRHADIYVNIQGDEPLLHSEDLQALARRMQDAAGIPAATLYAPISAEEAANPNVVKVVMTHDGRALYFSRSPIPYPRDAAPCRYWGHIGVYAYRADTLERFGSLPASPLEQTEKLEQLRLLQAGVSLHGVRAGAMGRGVDTQEDLEAVRAILEGREARPVPGRAAGAAGETPQPPGLENVKLIITDVDGVLTDGSLYYGPSGETVKSFNVKDGLGVLRAHEAGLKIAVLTGRDCAALRARLTELGITLFETGRLQKVEACRRLMTQAGATPAETLFLGDDLPDAAAFACCAFGVAVADAMPRVREQAAWITEAEGGRGALREVIDRVLAARQL